MPRRLFDLTSATRALRYPAFRWFVLGRIAGSPTGPMRQVAQGWLIYALTGSAFALSWISAARAVTMVVLTPLGGVLCDRFEKRRVMLAARAILITASAGLALLFYLGWIKPWHIAVVAMLEGAAFSLMDPAMLTIVSELVDSDLLMSAISVSAIAEGLMGIAGAAVAGLLIQWIGAGGVYVAMGVLFVGAAATLVRLPGGVVGNPKRAPILSDLTAGAQYVFSKPVLVTLLGLAFVRLTLSQPTTTLLPAFARKDLGLGPTGLGLLTSMTSAGMLISSMGIAYMGDTRHKGMLLLAAGIAAAAAAILLVRVKVLPLPYIVAVLTSALLTTGDIVTRTLLQTHSAPSYRGRVGSLMMMLYGIISLITLPTGVLADRYGVPLVLTLLALAGIGAQLALGLWRAELREM